MFPIMRNGGNGRVKSGLSCARHGAANVRAPQISNEIGFASMKAPILRSRRPDRPRPSGDCVDISGCWRHDAIMYRALIVATLFFVGSHAVSAQPQSVLHIRIVIVDSEQKPIPVPRHVLLIS